MLTDGAADRVERGGDPESRAAGKSFPLEKLPLEDAGELFRVLLSE
jgi:hypothetical protein